MAKRKVDAQFHVGDGAGGLTPIQDLRFDTREWLVRLRIPSRHAQEWMAQLGASHMLTIWCKLKTIEADDDKSAISIFLQPSTPAKLDLGFSEL